MSPLHTHFLFLFRYDAWANAAVAAALQTARRDGVPLDKADRLFAHLTQASDVWYGRVACTEAAGLPIWPNAPADLDPEAGAARGARVAKAWRAFLAAASDADLQRPVAYANSRGDRFTTPLAEIAAHVVNHGSHHRGQIAALLRGAGYAPPALDLIAYTRSHDRLRHDSEVPS